MRYGDLTYLEIKQIVKKKNIVIVPTACGPLGAIRGKRIPATKQVDIYVRVVKSILA